MNNSNDVIEIDLLELLRLLISKLWIIIPVGVMGGLIGLTISLFFITPTYQSTTKIYILNKNDSSTVTYSDVQLGTQLTKDYAELISSRYVIEEVIQKLQLDLDYKALCNKIAVSTPSDTRIVSITVEDSDPVAAMNIANAVRESASFHIKNVMDIDAVNIVETANMPTSKASPNNFRWLVIGGMLGAFFVIVIVLIRYLTDDTIKSTDDIEKYLGLSTLGIIPVMQEEYDGEKKKKRMFNRHRKA